MPLSEHEQRLLEEMERSLYQNDAEFVASVEGAGRGRLNYRSIVIGILVAVVGLAVLVTGVVIRQPLVGVAGFGIMLAGVFLAVTPSRRRSGLSADDVPAFPRASSSPSSSKPGAPGFMDKLNERWDNRQDGRE